MPRTPVSPVRAALVGVVGIVACWLLATPRYAGPDEPSHAVAAAALVRGHTSGHPIDVGYPADQFDVPAMVADPNPGCFAFRTDITADCAGSPIDSTALQPRESTSANYPVWGHVLPGLASFVPWPAGYLYLARAFNSLLGVALVVGAFVRARRATSPWLLTGLAVGLTPIAWFSFAIVSPSALAIAGGVALWTALLAGPAPHARGSDLLLVAGWLAVLLPRRDGPLWATLIVLLGCIAAGAAPSALWRRLDRLGRAAVLGSLPLPLLPIVMNGLDKLNLALAFVPLAIPLGELAVGRAQRRGIRRVRALPALVAALVVVGVAVLAANVVRPGGFDGTETAHVVSNTGRHLRQLVGVLGWLDAPIPEVAVLLWWLVLGGLFALAVLTAPRHAVLGAAALGTTIVVAWVLEIGTGDTTATYWQGRYSMPFAVGVPLLLTAGIATDAAARRRIGQVVLGAVWLLWNAAFFNAMHRWGSGLEGTIVPWRWHGWHGPGPITLYLVLHALASGWLLVQSLEPTRAGILDGS